MSKNKKRFGVEGERRKRYRDKYDFGTSFLMSPPKKGGWVARHKKRHLYAIENIPRLKAFCEGYKIQFEIKDDLPGKHHFWFYDTILNQVYHWYPSSAKFVIDPNWQDGIHVHEHLQVINLLMILRTEAGYSYRGSKIYK